MSVFYCSVAAVLLTERAKACAAMGRSICPPNECPLYVPAVSELAGRQPLEQVQWRLHRSASHKLFRESVQPDMVPSCITPEAAISIWAGQGGRTGQAVGSESFPGCTMMMAICPSKACVDPPPVVEAKPWQNNAYITVILFACFGGPIFGHLG